MRLNRTVRSPGFRIEGFAYTENLRQSHNFRSREGPQIGGRIVAELLKRSGTPDSQIQAALHRWIGTVSKATKKMDFDSLLPVYECAEPRTPTGLRDWVLDKCNLFAGIPELRKPVLLRQGAFKWFHEEIYPLSLFAVHRYGNRNDVFFVPEADKSRDVDAWIREPSLTIPIEITSARDPSEYLRMEYFVEHHYVPLTGPISTDGTKKQGRKIGAILECVDREEARAEHLGFIKNAAEGKMGPGRYGMNYELVISVEDRWFEPDDANAIGAFIEKNVLTLPLEFGRLHLVGLMGRLFMSFDTR